MSLVMNTEIETRLVASHGGHFDCWLFMPEYCMIELEPLIMIGAAWFFSIKTNNFDSCDTYYCLTLVYRTFDIVDQIFHLFHNNTLL